MDRSVIVLSGGCAGKLEDRCVLEVRGKPLIQRVVNAVDSFVDEVLVVVDSQERADRYAQILGPHVKYVVDAETDDLLVSALKGFEAATQKYAFLVSADAPFLSAEVLDLLFDLCPGRSAVVPRWPNAGIEALHSVYRVDAILQAAREAVAEGQLSLEGVVEKMRGVRYVSTLVVEQFDPDLKTLFRVLNTPLDLKRAEVLGSPRKTKDRTKRRSQ